MPGLGLESAWIPQPSLPDARMILRLMVLMLRSDHCSVNIGEGVVVTGNYPEVNTVNM